MMLRQRTVKSSVTTVGIGLHSGERVSMTLRPAAIDTGIRFRRMDLEPVAEVSANAYAVGDTRLASTIQAGEAKVSTVEHLMAALAGLGIDNLWVDLSGPEVPIMDGSAGTFVYLLQSAGLQEQNAPKKFLEVLQAVEVRDGDKWARLDPYFGFRIEFEIDFAHPAVDRSAGRLTLDFAETSFIRDIARARTFGFMQDVESLRAVGLARGGSFDNAIVLDEYRVLNDGGLRFDDEFVKHKTLDAIGDLYLAGHPLLGAYSAYKSGHGLNNALLRAALSQVGAVQTVEFVQAQRTPKAFAQDWAWA